MYTSTGRLHVYVHVYVYMYMYTSTGFCTELQAPPIRSRDFDVTTLWYRADWWNAQQQIFLGIDPSFVSLRCFHLRGKHGGHYRKEKVLRRSDWLKSAPVIVNQELFFFNKKKQKTKQCYCACTEKATQWPELSAVALLCPFLSQC